MISGGDRRSARPCLAYGLDGMSIIPSGLRKKNALELALGACLPVSQELRRIVCLAAVTGANLVSRGLAVKW